MMYCANQLMKCTENVRNYTYSIKQSLYIKCLNIVCLMFDVRFCPINCFDENPKNKDKMVTIKVMCVT